MGDHRGEREGFLAPARIAQRPAAERGDAHGIDLVQVRAGHHARELQLDGGEHGDGGDGVVSTVSKVFVRPSAGGEGKGDVGARARKSRARRESCNTVMA